MQENFIVLSTTHAKSQVSLQKRVFVNKKNVPTKLIIVGLILQLKWQSSCTFQRKPPLGTQ